MARKQTDREKLEQVFAECNGGRSSAPAGHRHRDCAGAFPAERACEADAQS